MDTNKPFSFYLLDIEEIDDQHRTLFGYIDALELAIKQDSQWLTLHDLLDKLHRWAEVHFAVEESLMRILRYPDIDAHCSSHLKFMQNIRTRRENVITSQVTLDTAQWLRYWLEAHIGGEDRRYAEFFREAVRTV